MPKQDSSSGEVITPKSILEKKTLKMLLAIDLYGNRPYYIMENRMDIQGEIQCITILGVYSIRSNVLLSFIPYLCIFYSSEIACD